MSLCARSKDVSKAVSKVNCAESASKTQDSLHVKMDSMDKEEAEKGHVLAKDGAPLDNKLPMDEDNGKTLNFNDGLEKNTTLAQAFDLADNVANKSECFECGKTGNRSKWDSLAFCDRCIIHNVIVRYREHSTESLGRVGEYVY